MPIYTPPDMRKRPASAPAQNIIRKQPDSRGAWLRTLHRWHWISSAVCLFSMLLFSVTGITLNHAGAFEARAHTETRTARLEAPLLEALRSPPPAAETPLPEPLRHWLHRAIGVDPGVRNAEWSAGDIYLALPRPGGDAWLSIDLGSGEVEYALTTRGWIAWANDLHKGRNTGVGWSWFIDLFAVACVLFSITGLLILHLRSANRPAAWPTVALGGLIPLLLIVFFVH